MLILSSRALSEISRGERKQQKNRQINAKIVAGSHKSSNQLKKKGKGYIMFLKVKQVK